MNSHREDIIDILSGLLSKDSGELSLLGDEVDLRQFGLNSIAGVDLVINLETRFNIALDDNDLLVERLNTIAKLESLLHFYLEKQQLKEA